jgi:hypothetical protein
MPDQDVLHDVNLDRIYAGEIKIHDDRGASDWHAGLWAHVQRSSSRPLRDAMRGILAQHVRWYTRAFDSPDEDMDQGIQVKVGELRDQGYAWLQIPPETVESIIHSMQGVCFLGAGSDEKFYFDPDFSDTRTTTLSTAIGDPLANIFDFPDIVRLAGNKYVLGVVREYLGALPRLSGMSLTLNQADRQGPIPSSDWHFDKGPICALKMFIYLNDINPRTGPHAYVAGSQDAKRVEEAVKRQFSSDPDAGKHLFYRQRWSTEEMNLVFPNSQIIHTGPAGLAFFEDTRGYHRATHIESGHRLMVTLEWALDPVPAGETPDRISFDSLPESIRPISDLAERRFRYIFGDFLA